jgi:cyclase
MYKRIIGLVLLENGIFCRTRNFVADYHYTNKFIDTKYFDEMVFIDVSSERTLPNDLTFGRGIEEVTEHSQLPIAIGGGIKLVDHIELFRTLGADRYVINQTSAKSDLLVSNSIKKYGRSSVISTINHWGPFVASREGVTEVRLLDRVREIGDNCGSDILLNSIERDGTLRGLDLDIVDTLSEVSEGSFILCGGLGNIDHLHAALQRENVVGVCTSNVYHLTTNTISSWRTNLASQGLMVRAI